MPSESSLSLSLVSKCMVFPDQKSNLEDLKLSVSDLPMLSCHYIQKGCLFTRPSIPTDSLITLLKHSLSQTLSLFPPLAGRLTTDSQGYIFITCNDQGIEFLHAKASNLLVCDTLSPIHVPSCFKSFFAFDKTVSYQGHFMPILAVQVTELNDGIFIGCSVNHAVTDGTSFWNFFNTFAEVCKSGARKITKAPEFKRDSVLVSKAVLQIPQGGPRVTFNPNEPLKERIFRFSRESILKLKSKVNNRKWIETVEILAKESNDVYLKSSIIESLCKNSKNVDEKVVEFSSFQSLCALLWRAVTRARKLPDHKTTTFRMAVNCRHRLEPKLNPFYFGNAIQSTPTYANAGEVLSNDLRWCAEQLNKSVLAHDDVKVREFVSDWESNPRVFPLGNPDGASITMGSSPRFPMYDNDFGWGRPLAVRSGGANKFDGKISAFPGREGGGSVELEVVLAPETMAGIESDLEFMHYVTMQ